MRRVLLFPAVALALATLGIGPDGGLTASITPRPGIDWPQFRGIAATGIAEGFSLPATWNAADGTNVDVLERLFLTYLPEGEEA